MASFDPISYALSKNYTNETVIGGGALKGAPCTIDRVEDIEGGHRITFGWELDDGTKRTTSIDVLDGTDGVDGVDGVSPEITVKTDTSSRYVLHIVTADGEFDTPNLRGGGSGGTSDYESLENLPSVNGNTLIGNKTSTELGISVVGVYNNENLTIS